MDDEARERVALLCLLTDTTAAILQACALGVNVELSNEALPKSKPWGLAFYRKALRNASKKLTTFELIDRSIGSRYGNALHCRILYYHSTGSSDIASLALPDTLS